jgi:predicted metal-dependent RNase
MADTAPSVRLTFDGAQKMLGAAIAKAKEMNVP